MVVVFKADFQIDWTIRQGKNTVRGTRCPWVNSIMSGRSPPLCCCCCCCCFLTLTVPLRIQPWSQDRRDQTKSNRESEISIESRQKRTDKEVASKGHRGDKIENINKNTQTVETN